MNVGHLPGTDPKQKKKDKTPLGLIEFLLTERLDLFETIWTTRNDILHDSDHYADMVHESQLNEKYSQATYLIGLFGSNLH